MSQDRKSTYWAAADKLRSGMDPAEYIRHLRLHLIPRYAGDCPHSPRGVQWISLGMTDYWTDADRTQAP